MFCRFATISLWREKSSNPRLNDRWNWKKYTASSGGYAKHEETKTKNSKNTAGGIRRPSWRSEHILHQTASSFLDANSWSNSKLIRIFTFLCPYLSKRLSEFFRYGQTYRSLPVRSSSTSSQFPAISQRKRIPYREIKNEETEKFISVTIFFIWIKYKLNWTWN